MLNEKLRKWLESRCRARPDRTWLVEAPGLLMTAEPTFVLPDEATKQAYVSRAVELGRFRLTTWSLAYALFLCSTAASNLAFALAPRHLLDTLFWVFIAFAGLPLLGLWATRSAEARFRAWLARAGAASVPAPVGQVEDARWWSSRPNELLRCRPGWIVAIEAFSFGAVLLALGWRYYALNAECLAAAGATEMVAALASGCFGNVAVVMLIMSAVLVAVLAVYWRDWWRWNKDRA